MNISYLKIYGENDSKKLIFLPYEGGSNYYKSLKNALEKGFHQYIISSEKMINVLSKFFDEKKVQVVNVELYMTDEYLEKKIDSLIKSINRNEREFDDLLDELKFISDEESIDIEKVKFKSIESPYFTIEIYINGNVIINLSRGVETPDEVLSALKGRLLNYIENK